MTKINNWIIQYFNQNKCLLDYESQDKFLNAFLTWNLQECFEEKKPKKIKRAFKILLFDLNIKEPINFDNFENIFYQIKQQKTIERLSTILYTYYNFQINQAFDFQEIYENFIAIKNQNIGIKLLVCFYQEMLSYLLNSLSCMDELIIDIILGYSFLCYALIPDDLNQSLLLIDNFFNEKLKKQMIIDFCNHLKKSKFYQNLNQQKFLNWDLDIKYQVIDDLIYAFPFKNKKNRYLRLIGKKFYKDNK